MTSSVADLGGVLVDGDTPLLHATLTPCWLSTILWRRNVRHYLNPPASSERSRNKGILLLLSRYDFITGISTVPRVFRGHGVNHVLFKVAELLSKPPGFYAMIVLMVACSIAVPLGVDENVVTFGLSVLAIVITGVVLIPRLP